MKVNYTIAIITAIIVIVYHFAKKQQNQSLCKKKTKLK
jgi:hypothetical protein